MIRAELRAVEGRAPRVRLVVAAPPARHTVARHGQALPPEAWSTPLWTDVGAVERFTATAPSCEAASYEVRATSAGQVLEIRVELRPEVRAAVEARAPDPPVVRPSVAHRIPGVVVGSAGLVTLGVAAGLGVAFLSRRGSIYDGCLGQLADGTWVCPASAQQGAQSSRDAATNLRTAAGVVAGIGGALVVSGGVMLLVMRSPASPAAWWVRPAGVGARSGGLAVEGAF